MAMMISNVSGQTSPTYDMNFLRAEFTNKKSEKNVVALFQVLPKDTANFPPVLSMKFTYSLGDHSEEKTVNIQKSNGEVEIVIFGPNMKEKDSTLFFQRHEVKHCLD
jgi:hypothetical protein